MSDGPLRWGQYHIEKGPRVREFWQARRLGGANASHNGIGF